VVEHPRAMHRRVLALALPAALCISCSAAPNGTVESDLRVVEAPVPRPVIVHEHEAPAAETADAPPASVDARSACDCASTSVVTEPDGTTWSAGWFRGKARFGAVTLHSRGESDVFLVKTDARGEI